MMIRLTYTINGDSVELGINPDGSSLFIWDERAANWKQLSAAHIVREKRINDAKHVRKAVYSHYRRHFAL